MRDDAKNQWRGAGAAPPSLKRTDAWGWARTSAVLGPLAGLAALALCWRAWPGAPAPRWSLGEALACGASGALQLAAADALSATARACSAAWAGLPFPDRAGMGARAALSGLAACAPAAILWTSFMTPRDAMIFTRGSARHGPESAAAALRSKIGARAKREPDHEIAPGVPYPSGKWAEHVWIVGGTGSGKSTCLRPMLEKALASGEQALVFDPKGEFTESFAGPILLAPWDARSFAWDIGRDMRNVGDMRRFAESTIEGGGTDPMWANASRMVLTGLLSCLRDTRGEDWGFSELAGLIASPQKTMARIMEIHHPEAARLIEKPTVTSHGILTNLASASAPIFDLARAWGEHSPARRVSMVEWALGRGPAKQIIMQGNAAYGPLTRAFARPCVEIVSSLVASAEMDEDRLGRKWFICDELPALGRVDFRLIVEQGRSRGYRCVLACQDFAQIEDIYGEKAARALTSMAGTVIVGRVGPGESAERLAKFLGAREAERPNVSVNSGAGGSSSSSFALERAQLYMPSELGSRLGVTEDGRGVVLALATEGEAYELFWPFHPIPKIRPKLVPAEWTKGGPRRVSTRSELGFGHGEDGLPSGDAAG